MTEENHCYENAKAERLNGILKQEYGLGETFVRKAEVVKAVEEAVMLYNHHRPHGALAYRVPMEVHREGEGLSRWDGEHQGDSGAAMAPICVSGG
jgi:transposase InsO family protein